MNYTYELKIMNYPSESYPLSLIPIDEVFEYRNNNFIEVWSIKVLKYKVLGAINKQTKKSFDRTKKWVTENHPELLI
jgi:hypothetical protein